MSAEIFRHRSVLAPGAVLSSLAVLALTPLAASATPAGPAFGPAAQIAPPAHSPAQSNAELDAVACAGNRACVAGGYVADPASGAHPWVVTQTGAAWKLATRLGLPADATTGTGGDGVITGISCAKAAACVAAGFYVTASGGERPVIYTGSGARWSAPFAPALPAGAQYAQLNGISCAGNGFCVAVGYYSSGGGNAFPIAITRPAGHPWGAITVLPAPADQGPSKTAYANAVSCGAAGSCVAVGTYYSAAAAKILGLRLSGGAWTATGISAPAASVSFYPPPEVNAVTCPAAATCLAIGTYTRQADGQARGMTIAVASGHFGPAITVATLPKGTVSSPDTTLRGISCAPAGLCVAVGSARNQAGHTAAIYLVRRGGTWTASLLAQPPNAITTALQYSSLTSVSCARAGHCTTVGDYDPKLTDLLAAEGASTG